jgi:hypothetical protein
MQVQFHLAEVQPKVFLITAEHRYDLGHLFVCVQEYYESGHSQWHGTFFERAEYQRWYAMNVSEDGIFSYPADWSGYNVPSWAIKQFYYDSPYPHDADQYDRAMKRIDTTISTRLGNTVPYYLIGTELDDLQTLDHEIAHGLYATSEQYRAQMNQLLAALPSKVKMHASKILTEMGYSLSVHDDETQAYFATGLIPTFKGFQRYCPPFIALFESHRTPLNFSSTIITSAP